MYIEINVICRIYAWDTRQRQRGRASVMSNECGGTILAILYYRKPKLKAAQLQCISQIPIVAGFAE